MIGMMTSVIEGKSTYTLNQVTLAFFCILILQAIFSFFRVYLFAQVSERVAADMRRQVYEKFISLPIPFFEQRRVGELISRITSDVSDIQETMSITLAEFVRQIATFTVGIGIIAFISWKLTLFMLATVPVLAIFAFFFGRYIREISKKTRDLLAEANVVVEETLQSIQVVKAFTNEKLEARRYSTILDKAIKNALSAAAWRGGFITFFIVGLFGGIVGVVWYGGNLVAAKEMQLSDLLTFLIYTMFIGTSVAGLGELYGQIQRVLGSSERILEILEEKSEIDIHTAENIYKRKIGSVSFKNVAFSYPSRTDMEVLKNISFDVKTGEKIALVGQSGAGKSTIVQLLMRYYDISNGEITVDNQNIQEQNITDLRKNIAIVPQEVMLFGGTIYENIIYGNPDATQQEVQEAAQRANALDFINSFPEGFETIVGERGVKLSGGQRQRIAIARAILKDPAILILDEATSSLDAESERLVQDALDELMQNRTTIIIAHRLATIRSVDCIYVLRDGEITEQGKHDELVLKEGGIYANLIKLQFEAPEVL
jgi:ABC-type multidrug transport system fused ATPase/permease subunit